MLQISAFAKINLFLEVLGQRADGYHSLSTVFQEVSLADDLRVSSCPSRNGESAFRLRCIGADLPSGPENLVVRAAQAFSARFEPKMDYDVSLRKRIPVGAGLGGGSSDAASMLKACWALQKEKPLSRFPWKQFVPLAASLGADVPFFLHGGLAKGGGIGERLKPLKESRIFWYVLVFPRVPVPTKWVFQQLRLRRRLTKPASLRRLESELERGAHPRKWAGFCFNRLEEVVLPKVPQVAFAKRALIEAGCLSALMSGSGSSVFGLVESEAAGREAISKLKSRPWDVWLVHSRMGRCP